MEKIFVGIDVSKGILDLALPAQGGYRDLQYANDSKGIKSLLKDMPANAVLVMEASGPYHLRLAYAGFGAGFEVCVSNPLCVKRYCQMKLRRTKTDKADARSISEFGQATGPQAWTPPLSELNHLQQLDSLIALATKQRTQLRNHRAAHQAQPYPNKAVTAGINAQLTTIERMVAKLKAEVDAIVEKHFKKELSKLLQIPGVGRVTAVQILIVTGNFLKFNSAKSLVAYVGLCPRIYQSGKSQRTSFSICKLGQGRLRSLLFMCAMSAKKTNPSCKELFDRLTIERGKCKKLALVAVAAKLLRQSFAIGTTMSDFKPNYIRNQNLPILDF